MVVLRKMKEQVYKKHKNERGTPERTENKTNTKMFVVHIPAEKKEGSWPYLWWPLDLQLITLLASLPVFWPPTTTDEGWSQIEIDDVPEIPETKAVAL